MSKTIYSSHASACSDCKKEQPSVRDQLNCLIDAVVKRDPDQPEFHQAFREVAESLLPVFERDQKYLKIFGMIAEPERVLSFRVNWTDDAGQIHTNRGYRVQFNSAIGPYKGGLRLHPQVNLSVLKFLGFEQIFKNSLTGLPMGGGKGGSDFDPKGKSDTEVRAFCQSFMTELSRHIGPDTDVPAGDIGTGGREIGFMFGQYKRLRNEFTGTLTGKGANWGGSLARPEATGYGAVYFSEHLLKDNGFADGVKGLKVVVSGSGNAAQYAAEKLVQLGAVVLSVSDSNGTLEFTNGMTKTDLQYILDLKNVKRGRLSDAKLENTKYHAGQKPWTSIKKIDIAYPSATQNEINEADAKALAAAGCKAVIEVANMPSTAEAIKVYRSNKILFAPGKAANAGGVSVSGMEMAQNSCRIGWSFEEVDKRLQDVMKHIYTISKNAAEEYGKPGDLELGANIAGFVKVADSMIDQGLF